MSLRPIPLVRPSSPFILVAAVDDSSRASRVLDAALDLQATMTDAELHLVHVVNPSPAIRLLALAKQHTRLVNERATLLAALVTSARAAGYGAVVPHLREGDPAGCLVAAAAELDADLLILGGPAPMRAARRLHGSVAAEVSRRATCPLYFVREKEHHPRAHGYSEGSAPQLGQSVLRP